jgi:uncharacterized protein (UPF0548 family)
VLRFRRPSRPAVQELLARARAGAPTYPEVGATRGPDLPAGYHHNRDEIRLGRGQEVFDRAVQALRRWQAQRGAGIEVFPDGAWVDERETVLLLIRAGGLWATAPCRIVYIVEDADRFEFAYATLPGHPERGEAAFAICRDEAGAVVFRVTSFSRPADPLARLGAPFARRIQRRVTQRYLEVLAEAASGR